MVFAIRIFGRYGDDFAIFSTFLNVFTPYLPPDFRYIYSLPASALGAGVSGFSRLSHDERPAGTLSRSLSYFTFARIMGKAKSEIPRKLHRDAGAPEFDAGGVFVAEGRREGKRLLHQVGSIG